MQRAAVVYNPISGAGLGAAIAAEAEELLTRSGYAVTVAPTVDRSGATAIVCELAPDIDRLIVAGGDGTLRESLIGLGHHRSRVDVGFLPIGNANVAARELGIPLDAHKALPAIVEGEAIAIDLGEVRTDGGVDLFLAMVGVGWDAITVRYISRLRHTRIGAIAYRVWADLVYVLCGLLASCHLRPTRFRVELDGRSAESGGEPADYCAAHFCNFQTYGKGMSMAPAANAMSGRLHHQLRKRSWLPALIWHLIAAQFRLRVPGFISRYAESETVHVESDAPIPVQIDGDYHGEWTSLDVRVLPKAARILVNST